VATAREPALQPAGISTVLVLPASAHPGRTLGAGGSPHPLRPVPIRIPGDGLTDPPLPGLELPDELLGDPAASAHIQALALRPGANLGIAIR
jgi:fermentation-respiration switch protein FrsA (DUF1100 family)